MATTELATGSTFGEKERYRLEGLLGTGGMASVWRATDVLLQRVVAVKFLSDVLALDPRFIARFEREARVAAGLTHPHLVHVFDFRGDRSRPYLVMEYVDGGTLADRIRNRDAPSLKPETLFREILDAVGYIHGAGIVHRDIKPANILVGRDGRIRITDFGIARPSAASAMTNSGLVLGTARYIAPEVLRGQSADQRSDLYSCGVVFADCLRPASPLHLHSIARTLTSPDPSQRPGSAAEALELISRPDVTAPTRLHPGPAAPPKTSVRPARPPEGRRPSVTRSGNEVRVHLKRRNAALLVAAALIAVVCVVILAGAGGSSTSKLPTALPVTAPVSQQLNRLDQMIGRARR